MIRHTYKNMSRYKVVLTATALALLLPLCAAQAQMTPEIREKMKKEAIERDRLDREEREKNLPKGQKLVEFSKPMTLEEVGKAYPFMKPELEKHKSAENLYQSSIKTTARIAEDKGERANIFFMGLTGDFYCSNMMGCVVKVYSDLQDKIGYRPAIELLTKHRLKIERLNGKIALLHDTDEGEVRFEMQPDGTFVMLDNYIEQDHEGTFKGQEKPPKDPFHGAESEAEKAIETAVLAGTDAEGHPTNDYRTNTSLTADLVKAIDRAGEDSCRGVNRDKVLCGITFDPITCSQDPPRAWVYETVKKTETEAHINARPKDPTYQSTYPQYKVTKTDRGWKISGIRCGSSNFNMK